MATETGDTLVRAFLPSAWAVGEEIRFRGVQDSKRLGELTSPRSRTDVDFDHVEQNEPDAAREDELIAEVAAITAMGAN